MNVPPTDGTNKELLEFFTQWLRENNFQKTESALFSEIQHIQNKPEVEEERKLEYPFEAPCGGPAFVAKPIVKEDCSEVPESVTEAPHVEQVESLSEERVDTPPAAKESEDVKEDVIDDDDVDEWTDPDDLGYIRVPVELSNKYGETKAASNTEQHDDQSPVGIDDLPNKESALAKQTEENLGSGADSGRDDNFESEDVKSSPTKKTPDASPAQSEPSDSEVGSYIEEAGEDATGTAEAGRHVHQEVLQQQYLELQNKRQVIQQQLQHTQAQSDSTSQNATAASSHQQYPNADSTDNSQSRKKSQPVFEAFNLKIIYEVNKTGFEEHKDYPIRMYDIIAGRYQILEYLGSAAFSRAVQCVDLKTGQLVCIKIIRNNKDFLDQGLDEIKLLHYINSGGNPDENRVVQLFDYFYHKEHLFLVCELLRDNLYEFSKYNRESGDEPYFSLARLQSIARQSLIALRYIHSLGLIHCDLKPENILIKSYSRCEIKVIDFGSSCFTTDHLSSYVQSRCYRAPEVIMGLPYDYNIDIWSLGAILPELFNGRVLFHNESISTMLARIVAICGDVPEHMLQSGRHSSKFFTEDGIPYEVDKDTNQVSHLLPKRTKLKHRVGTSDSLFLDFISKLIAIDPQKRLSADEALKHPFLFHDYGPINPQ